MTQRVYDEMALEELRLLQTIISKHDDLRAQLIGWAVTLIGVLSAAYLSDKSGLGRRGFLLVGGTVAFLFFWMDVVYKVAQDRAIARSERVESGIRAAKDYDGPLIGESLAQPNSLEAQRHAAANPRVWFPFVVLLILVLFAAFGHN